jgi:hypothetical protein
MITMRKLQEEYNEINQRLIDIEEKNKVTEQRLKSLNDIILRYVENETKRKYNKFTK